MPLDIVKKTDKMIFNINGGMGYAISDRHKIGE
jgi:hypothetical protein